MRLPRLRPQGRERATGSCLPRSSYRQVTGALTFGAYGRYEARGAQGRLTKDSNRNNYVHLGSRSLSVPVLSRSLVYPGQQITRSLAGAVDNACLVTPECFSE